MNARLLSIQCRMNAILARVEGMKAFNSDRALMGYQNGYGDQEFCEAEAQLLALAKEVEVEVENG